MGDKLRYFFHEIFQFLTNKRFILNLLGIIGFLLLVLLLVFGWLRSYTHHGQKLELPNYVDQHIDKATEDAKARTFEIIVNDSVHIVGKSGGIIQNQNPRGGSLVKQSRKIYVTTTKYKADKVDLASMNFYGEDYAQVEAQLRRRNVYMTIKSRVPDYLAPNTVKEVWYQGKRIISQADKPATFVVDKGETLELVVSSSQGGTGSVKRLINSSVSTARFIMNAQGIDVVVSNPEDAPDGDVDRAIIVSQDPPANTSLPRGSTVKVTIEK